MNKIRLKFVRGEEVKYISHLDLMKVFERASRRAKLPIAYSQGFNPHPQMVFGLPLSVGVTSEAEYGDFELSELVEPVEFMERLNAQLPKGLRILEAKPRHTKDNIMATIAAASYIILAYTEKAIDLDCFREKIDTLMSQKEIIVKKEGKKGPKDIDIRPMIQKLEAVNPGDLVIKGMQDESATGNHLHCDSVHTEYFREQYTKYVVDTKMDEKKIICLYMLLSAGSKANLKPELLFSKLGEVADTGLTLVKIHRTGLFVGQGVDLLYPLDDYVLLAI